MDHKEKTPVVSVTMKYWIGTSDTTEDPTKKITFTSSSQDNNNNGDAQVVEPARIGLPLGVEPTKPQAGSYDYSGMHDHGPLVPPVEGGDMAQLVGCVQAAQAFHNDYMTQVIQDEQKQQK